MVAKPGATSRQEFAEWMAFLTDSDLRELLTIRKSFRAAAKKDLGAYQEARAKEEARIAALRKKMEQQKETAKKERSMIFNAKTQKMEIFDNPYKKEEKK